MSHSVKTTTTTTRQTTVSISSFRNIESGWSVETHSIKSICENHPIDCCWLQIDIDSRAKSITLIAFRVFRYATLSLRLLWFRFVGRFVQTSPFTVAAPAAPPWMECLLCCAIHSTLLRLAIFPIVAGCINSKSKIVNDSIWYSSPFLKSGCENYTKEFIEQFYCTIM